MEQGLRRSAATAEATRRAIQPSRESLRASALRDGVDIAKQGLELARAKYAAEIITSRSISSGKRSGPHGSENRAAVAIKLDERKHFAADSFIADPEDKNLTRLQSFFYVRKFEEKGAK